MGSVVGSLRTVPCSMHLVSFCGARFCAHKVIVKSAEKTDSRRSLMPRCPRDSKSNTLLSRGNEHQVMTDNHAYLTGQHYTLALWACGVKGARYPRQGHGCWFESRQVHSRLCVDRAMKHRNGLPGGVGAFPEVT